MKSIQIAERQPNQTKTNSFSFKPSNLLNRYTNYTISQGNQKVYWFMKAIIIIPCVIMVPAIAIMHLATPNFIWFIALCMVLFFTNLIVHIAEFKSKVYIPIFHLSILLMTFIPAITYFLNQYTS